MARLLQLAVGGSLVALGSGFVAPRASAAAPLKAGDDDVYAERLDALVEDLKPPAAAAPAPPVAAPARAKPAAIVPKRRLKNSDEWYMLALPFQPRSGLLDGTLAADAGFDPAGLATSKVDLYSFREAEVKHSRLAMLCAAGWPLGELWDDGIATTLGLPSIVAENAGRDPSLLNGGLQLINPLYWVSVCAAGERRRNRERSVPLTPARALTSPLLIGRRRGHDGRHRVPFGADEGKGQGGGQDVDAVWVLDPGRPRL
jgi:hypothetical protein